MPSTAVSTATASGTASDGPGEFRIATTACWRYWSRCGIGEDPSAGSDVNAASRLVMVDNSFRTVAGDDSGATGFIARLPKGLLRALSSW